MGGAVAILAAAKEPRIGAVVADTSYAEVRELLREQARIRARMPAVVADLVLLAARAYRASIGRLRPIDLVHGIAPRPFLIVHGGQDVLVPVAHASRLAGRAPGAELWIVDEAGHCGGFHCRRDEYLDRVAEICLRAQPVESAQSQAQA